MKIETDTVEVRSGVRHGRTLGSPIAAPGRQPRLRQLGGADEPLAGRGVRARRGPPAAARATPTWSAPRNTATPTSATCSSGPAPARPPPASPPARSPAASSPRSGSRSTATCCRSPRSRRAERDDLTPEDFAGVDDDPVRCLDPEASKAMVEEINRLRKANESLGGSFEVRVFGLVPGLGSHISWEDRLDGRLAGAVASIQSVKGVAIGEAWDVAGRPGSEAHDEIFWSEKDGYFRETNHAGGLEGGMTNGQPLSVRAAIKPISTLTKPLRSVDTETKQPAQALRERTDSTVVPAAAVVAEAMVALTLARAYREKFGGDHIDDVLAALARLQAAHRLPGLRPVSEAGDRLHRLHGGRQEHRARRRPRGRAGDGRDRRADGSASSASRSARGLRAGRGGGLPGARGRGRRRAAGAAPTAARSPSAAAASSPSGCARRSAATSSSCCEIDAAEAWRRIEGTRAAAGDQRSRRRAPARRAAAALRGAGRRGRADGRPRRRRAGAAGDPGAGRDAGGDEAAVGVERLGRVPGVRRRRACSADRAGGRCRAARFCVTDANVAALYAERLGAAGGASRDRPRARSRRRWSRPRRCCASWPERG